MKNEIKAILTGMIYHYNQQNYELEELLERKTEEILKLIDLLIENDELPN